MLLPIGWPNVQVSGSGDLGNDASAVNRAREQAGSPEAAALHRAQNPRISKPEPALSKIAPVLSEADRAVAESILKKLEVQVANLKAELGQQSAVN